MNTVCALVIVDMISKETWQLGGHGKQNNCFIKTKEKINIHFLFSKCNQEFIKITKKGFGPRTKL